MMEANDSIVKALPAASEELTDVFVQCQDAALQIGTHLETFGEQYRQIVEILEDYCEKVYQMSIATTDGNACRKLSKKIRKQLTELQNRIQCQMPEDRKEVVFLPYKASMWDSLESVWKAADENENTDAYVIPIPYYDRNPDGSFREEHYEGDLYPDYVPITRYDEYDFESRRPDMIFIHNPYDNSNYVTSVHPFFYSSNLKKFTDELIYIPYFVLGEPDVNNEEALEGIRHFCITTGVFNADKVVVQSENMKKAYVKILTDFMKEQSGEDTKEYWEKKILGAGSPKMDKVMAAKQEDVVVPEEWLKVIEKPDGSWKKIIFYNTSVQALLNHNEKMNAKIKDVLRAFKENREEVALLWRPHPLIEATIKSVRPRLWEEYKEIVDTYKSEGWGIYDDTADLDRAIVMSDAYYGDPSSIVQLYQETGKPVMYQSVEKEYEKVIRNDGMYQEGETAWFVGNNDNTLYKMMLSEGIVTSVAFLPGNSTSNYRIYPRCIKRKSNIYCIPDKGNCIQIYDIENGSFEQIFIKNPLNKRLSILNSWIDNEKLWCVLYGLNQLIKVDLQRKIVELTHSIFLNGKDTCGFESVKVDKYIYCISRTSTCIVEFDVTTNLKRTYNVQCNERGFNTITVYGTDLYLTGYSKCIYCWNIISQKVIKYNDFPESIFEFHNTNKMEGLPLFYQSMLVDNKIIFVPWKTDYSTSNSILKFDLADKKICACVLYSEDFTRKTGEQFTIEYTKEDSVLGIHDEKQEYIAEIDVNSLQISKKKMKFVSEKEAKFWEKNIYQKKYLNESFKCSLDMFLRLKFSEKKLKMNMDNALGKKIWKILNTQVG